MRKIALLTEFEGTAFSGWQEQPARRTVQGCLQAALASFVPEEKVTVHGCSRTDAGVHARGHVCHFQTAATIPPSRLPLALASKLPDDLIVKAAQPVPDSFHARFLARGKRYSYTYWNHTYRQAIGRQTVCHVPGYFDVEAFRRAMPIFLGERDFSALKDQNHDDLSPMRRIDRLSLSVKGSLIRLTVEGSGFLYHMVRILAGTLLAAAQGKLSPEDIAAGLQAKDRRLMGKTMPACGLCLEEVFYDPPLFAQAPEGKEREEHAQYTLE